MSAKKQKRDGGTKQAVQKEKVEVKTQKKKKKQQASSSDESSSDEEKKVDIFSLLLLAIFIIDLIYV